MEPMMCGYAVVASNNRGHRELVEDGITGFIVEPTNIKNFADKIIKVIDASEKYSKSALKRASLFTDKNVYKELNNIYFK